MLRHIMGTTCETTNEIDMKNNIVINDMEHETVMTVITDQIKRNDNTTCEIESQRFFNCFR